MRILFVILFFTAAAEASFAQSPLCVSRPTTFCCEYVSSVTINGKQFNGSTGFTAASGGNPAGYYDYTAALHTIPTITAGKQISIQYTAVTNGNYMEYFKLWIDFNGNGVLTDAGELVHSFNTAWTGTKVVTSTFIVPTTVFNGQVYMRFIMQYSGSPVICGTYPYGNTFDFVTNITGAVQPPSFFSYSGSIKDNEGNGESAIGVKLNKKLKNSSTFSLHGTYLTDPLGNFQIVTSLDTSMYNFQVVFPQITPGNLSTTDATYFNQKIFTSNLQSVDYYRADVNRDGSVTITDIYSIFQKTHGFPWKAGVPSFLYFNDSDWNTINLGTSNLNLTIPGFQSIIINNAISSGVTNLRLVKTGFKN